MALGSVMVVPAKSFVTLTWQPSRELFEAVGSVKAAVTAENERDARVCQAKGEVEHVLLRCRWSGQPRDSSLTRRPREAKTHILIVIRLLELVVDIVLENDMASRACHRLLARSCDSPRMSARSSGKTRRDRQRTFNVQIIFPRDVDDVVSLVRLDRDNLAVGLLEMQGDPVYRFRSA